jgi:hypothetical protein
MIDLWTRAEAVGQVRWLMEHGKLRIGERKLRASEVSVLLEYAANANEHLLTWCPQEIVAARTGLSQAQVKRAMQELVGDGNLLRFASHRGRGIKVYRLTLPTQGVARGSLAAAQQPVEATSATTEYRPVFRKKGEVIPMEERERERLEYEARHGGCAS